MKFSFICAIYGTDKIDYVERLILSISKSEVSKQLIVVDQNKSDILEKYIKKISNELELIYLKSSPGLSKARNLGLKKADGDIVCFPDDDCEYPKNCLEKIRDFFKNKKNKYSGIVISVKETKYEYLLPFTNKKYSGQLSFKDVFTNGCSISIFHQNIYEINFDQQFGMGSKYKSCEDYDYLIRLMKRGVKFYFEKNIFIKHPDPKKSRNIDQSKKIETNSLGHGAYFRKHLSTLWVQLIYYLTTPIIGMIIFVLLDYNKAVLYKKIFIQRMKGFILYENS